MSTVVLGISDPHWTEKKPRSRKDPDWLGTIKTKIEKLCLLAEKYKKVDGIGADAVQIAGDLFHIPEGDSIRRRLDTLLISLLSKFPCPIYAIPGNHDLEAERLESLANHPYGVLTGSGIIADLCWPRYAVVGTNPPVILTGRQYTPEGPGVWLSELATTGALVKLKEEIHQTMGVKPFVVAMTHNHWGTHTGSDEKHIRRTAKTLLLGTGIDVCHYGDPHTYDGVEEIRGIDEIVYLVGPGAFMRGSLAEHDINRKPMIASMLFSENQPPDIKMIPVPHLPATEVFNLEQHRKTKEREAVQQQFFARIKNLESESRTQIDQILESFQDQIEPEVINIVKQSLILADQNHDDIINTEPDA